MILNIKETSERTVILTTEQVKEAAIEHLKAMMGESGLYLKGDELWKEDGHHHHRWHDTSHKFRDATDLDKAVCLVLDRIGEKHVIV